MISATPIRRGHRRRGRRRDARRRRGGSAGSHRGADQALPDPQPHRRGPGRHVRRAGQRRRGQLGVAHLRHRQGRRLPGRPGRRRDHVQGGHRRGARPGEDGAAVQPHPRGPHRPAPLRRAHPRPRQGPGAPGLLRRRPHRPHDPADAVPELRQARRRVLQRVLRAGPGAHPDPDGPGGHRRRRLRAGHRRDPRLPRQGGRLRHRRLRQDVQDHLQRAHPDRRRHRHRVPQGTSAGGHGVLPVPPDRPGRPGHPALRGRARRGRPPAQRGGRALHGALRPDDQGPRAARHRRPLDGARGARGPRRRPAQGLRLPRPAPPRRGRAGGEAARHHRVRPHLPGRRAGHRAGPGLPDRALRDGRHPDQRHRTRCCGTTRPPSRACTPPASAPACRCTAPTGWAPTRCWTSTSSAAGPASPRPSTRSGHDFVDLPPDPAAMVVGWVGRHPLRARQRARRRHPRRAAADDGQQRRGVPHRGDAQAGAHRHPRAQGALPRITVHDKGKRFNSDLLEADRAGLPARPGRGHRSSAR